MGRKLSEPGTGIAVRWRSPVAARRQRTAGGNLGAIRQCRPFELAHGEKPGKKNLKPVPDLFERVAPLFRRGSSCGPAAFLHIAPGLKRKERNLGRRKAVAGHIIKIEILQGVGSDLLLV